MSRQNFRLHWLAQPCLPGAGPAGPAARSPRRQKLEHCRGEVEIRHLDFSYRPDRPLIQDFNLVAKPGQHIALVGPTGCGKTTVINLLMRFYEPNQGEILVDGQPITSLIPEQPARRFGMVLQDTWLFSGTVRENIAYSRPDATEQEVIAAAKSGTCRQLYPTSASRV